MNDKDKLRTCYYSAGAIIAVLLVVIFYLWHEYSAQKAPPTKSGYSAGRVPDNPSNPTRYEYRKFLEARAAPPERMMNTHHWDQEGTYQHTADTWGLPVLTDGDSRVNYSGFSKENMSVGAHWVQEGTYGHTGDTLPSFGLSGYYEDVPTDTSA